MASCTTSSGNNLNREHDFFTTTKAASGSPQFIIVEMGPNEISSMWQAAYVNLWQHIYLMQVFFTGFSAFSGESAAWSNETYSAQHDDFNMGHASESTAAVDAPNEQESPAPWEKPDRRRAAKPSSFKPRSPDLTGPHFNFERLCKRSHDENASQAVSTQALAKQSVKVPPSAAEPQQDDFELQVLEHTMAMTSQAPDDELAIDWSDLSFTVAHQLDTEYMINMPSSGQQRKVYSLASTVAKGTGSGAGTACEQAPPPAATSHFGGFEDDVSYTSAHDDDYDYDDDDDPGDLLCVQHSDDGFEFICTRGTVVIDAPTEDAARRIFDKSEAKMNAVSSACGNGPQPSTNEPEGWSDSDRKKSENRKQWQDASSSTGTCGASGATSFDDMMNAVHSALGNKQQPSVQQQQENDFAKFMRHVHDTCK